jgi:hypothetical protein
MKTLFVIIRLCIELFVCIMIYFEAGIFTAMFALMVTIQIEYVKMMSKKHSDITENIIKIIKKKQ